MNDDNKGFSFYGENNILFISLKSVSEISVVKISDWYELTITTTTNNAYNISSKDKNELLNVIICFKLNKTCSYYGEWICL